MTPVSIEKSKAATKKAWNDLFRVVAVALFFLGAALMLNHPYVQKHLLDIDVIRHQMQFGGWKSNLLFIGVASMVNTFGIPRMWICALAGSFFGAVEGGIVGLVATLMGSSLNFLIGRSLLRGPIKRNMPRRLKHWYTAFNKNGFRAILYLRLFPLTNATLTNLLGGASQMRYRDYLGATVIGYLPFTIAFATLGSSAAKQNGWQLAGGLALFAAVVLGQWGWSYFRKKQKSTAEQARNLPGHRSIETRLERESKI